MSTKFLLARDINGYPSMGLRFPSDNYTSTLTVGGGATPVTVPDNYAYWVVRIGFKEGATVWIANNATATVPTDATLKANASVLVTQNNCEFIVEAGDVLSLLTPDATANVSVSFYAVGNQP